LITQLRIALALTLQLYGLLFLWKCHEVQASNFTTATPWLFKEVAVLENSERLNLGGFLDREEVLGSY